MANKCIEFQFSFDVLHAEEMQLDKTNIPNVDFCDMFVFLDSSTLSMQIVSTSRSLMTSIM